MTNEAIYNNLCAMLRDYSGLMSEETAIENLIAHPEHYVTSALPFYCNAAALLIEAKAKLDKRTSGSAGLSALKRVLKTCHREDVRAVFQEDDKWSLCDGYRYYRLNYDPTSLPHHDEHKHPGAHLPRNVFPDLGNYKPLTIPALSAVRLAVDKNKRMKREKLGMVPLVLTFGGVEIGINPQFLYDTLCIFPDAEFFTDGSPIHPIYVRSANGDAIILPVRLASRKAA